MAPVMVKRAFLDRWYYVDASRVPEATLQVSLTVHPRQHDEREVKAPIKCYDTSVPGYVGLPIDWGLTHFYEENFEDRTSVGQAWNPPSRPNYEHENAAPGQPKFHADLLQAMNEYYGILAVAPTGAGKTVVGLGAAADRGRSTLVICPSIEIAKQWKWAARDMLGMADQDIGTVQQKRCQYDRPLCIGIIHSCARHEYDEEFYSAFGTILWDEVHRVAAETFRLTLDKFYAQVKVGLTATKKRRDDAENVYLSYFGQGQVIAKSEITPLEVHVHDYRGFIPEWAQDDHGLRVRQLIRDDKRNDMLAQIIFRRWKEGRQYVVVSEHIEHLEELRDIAVNMGVPRIKTGMFTHSFNEDGKRIQTSDEYLEWCRVHPDLVFATYGKMKEGTDMPRLDGGMDASPQASATQLMGRVRRPRPGKRLPVWDTIRDTSCGPLIGYYNGRLRDYRADKKVTVIQNAKKTNNENTRSNR